MIELPDFKKAFEYENNFYQSCRTQRLSKFISHYELYRLTEEINGAIVECGVFKGVSLLRWAHFRKMFGGNHSKKIVGFDIFGEFPKTEYSQDQKRLDKFLKDAGSESISVDQLRLLLDQHGLNEGIELIEGNIVETVKRYVDSNPEFKISLLNLDTDIYEPAVAILEHLYPRLADGGILILDDYGVFPGETKAVDDYFINSNIKILKSPFASTPSYIIKNGE